MFGFIRNAISHKTTPLLVGYFKFFDVFVTFCFLIIGFERFKVLVIVIGAKKGLAFI